MDSKALLDEILKTGKDMADKGQAFAEEKLNMPDEGSERDAKMDGLKKGAMAAGVLALLLGTKAGRRVTGSAVKIGSLAAIGGIGYKAYQNWMAERASNEKEFEDMAKEAAGKGELVNFDKPSAEEEVKRSQVLLKAMVASAKADGHVNKSEIEIIKEQIINLNIDEKTASLLEDEIAKPLDVKEVAALAENQAMAAEIYLVSAVISNKENSMEREYLESLAQEMGLPDALVAQLQSVKEEDIS